MLILEQNEEKKGLVLGDYVTVHVPEISAQQSSIGAGTLTDIQVRNESFFQRIQKERVELTGKRAA